MKREWADNDLSEICAASPNVTPPLERIDCCVKRKMSAFFFRVASFLKQLLVKNLESRDRIINISTKQIQQRTAKCSFLIPKQAFALFPFVTFKSIKIYMVSSKGAKDGDFSDLRVNGEGTCNLMTSE